MNYIQQLQKDNEELRIRIKETADLIQDFKIHLLSAKFSVDTTIQVQDVLNRLDMISEKVYI